MPTLDEAGDFYQKHESKWIETYTGKKFNLVEPEFCHEDIAHTLSNLCRYNGHCRTFYSVAEHSLLVSALVYHMGGNQLQCLEALLHDATEAYLSDVPAPFKQLLPDWKKLDSDLEFKFRKWMDFPSDKTGLVKEADWLALFIEAYYLLPDKGECFIGPAGMRDRALGLIKEGRTVVYCLPPDEVEKCFLNTWADLAADIGYESYDVPRVAIA